MGLTTRPENSRAFPAKTVCGTKDVNRTVILPAGRCGKETGGPSQSRPLVFARQGRFNLTYDLTL